MVWFELVFFSGGAGRGQRVMNAKDIILEAQNFIFSTNERRSGQHYKYLINLRF